MSNHVTEATLSGSRSSPTISLDALLARQASLSGLDDFLHEPDALKALHYFLMEVTPLEPPQTTQDIRATIMRSIARIDKAISDQINAIIHHRQFQALEASWRGLWYLVVQAQDARNIKIKVLDITWTEVSRDIDKALDFDQSQLFHKIYSSEYGHPGGEPFGVLIGDYQISHRPSARHPLDDIATLEGIAQIAAASFAPFIAGASPELFGIDDFETLGQPLNLETIFSQDEYIRWRSLRAKADARFLGLALPRTLMRLPYRKRHGSYKGVPFSEQSAERGGEGYCWGNAAFAFGGVLIREFANVGWFGHIRGVPRDQLGGGLVTTLPVDTFDTDSGMLAAKPITDVIITDRRERELSELGFVPLCQCFQAPFAAFYSNASIQKPSLTGERQVNARLSAMLQHVLCGSRVAHYIKVMIRDKIGSFITPDACEDFLRQWLFRYTTGREDLEWEEQARYPLREAAVKVNEHPERPGQYVCVIHLVPHYQVDQMVSELELVTELVQSS
ncbi:type VI secretion system contractile sheath large subunit [Marinimicrobium alkaliphilum]|uniref:type VI secretion system contractile sheath large subunit n=1 Tax=Marinimicrobium alkaliphilum TaxID=2202654 RepID=UPI001E60A83B|nr:type VI secretion system contractile sheath large subunit [Marinimicrobium alkaliphilum]